jgi:murein DD-endopeptidase MepM/ murein hydrolase activator NlpD
MERSSACILLLIASCPILFFSCARQPAPEPEQETTEAVYVLSGYCLLQEDENIDFVLQKNDIDANERFRITESVQEYLDVRSCMPGDTMIITKDLQGRFCRFEYRKEPLLRYIVTREDTSYHAEKIEHEPAIVYEAITGTLSSSLYESITKGGESPELVFKFADIFAWVIDFLTECQSGDTFEIIVEREYFRNKHIRDRKIIAAVYRGDIGTYYAFYYMDPDEREDYYDEEGNSLRKQLLKSPLQYRRISSHFSLARMHPILKIRRPHYGIDFAAPRGTPVATVGDGHVVFAGWKGGYGKLVIINHPNSFKTYYGHLSRIGKGVSAGAKVVQGQVIGYVGSTGLSTGPHLHFGIKNYGKWVNPLKIDLPPAEPINEKYREMYLEEMEELLAALTYSEGVSEEFPQETDSLPDSLQLLP